MNTLNILFGLLVLLTGLFLMSCVGAGTGPQPDDANYDLLSVQWNPAPEGPTAQIPSGQTQTYDIVAEVRLLKTGGRIKPALVLYDDDGPLKPPKPLVVLKLDFDASTSPPGPIQLHEQVTLKCDSGMIAGSKLSDQGDVVDGTSGEGTVEVYPNLSRANLASVSGQKVVISCK